MKRPRRSTCIVSLACALAPAACATAKPTFDYQAEQVRASAYLVGLGDVLQVNAWKNDQVSQRVSVRPDGAITLPLLGDLPAAGKTVIELAADISRESKRFFTEPLSVTVTAAEIKSYRIYALGEVTKPGELAPTTQVNVLQALALAGGFSRFADADHVLIVRKDARGVRRIPFVYSQVVDHGDMRENITLQSGDTLIVP